MCGIAGWIDWERSLLEEGPALERMGATLAHRGPDAGAIWLSPRAGLSHRRLTVIDPAGGPQPMVITSARGAAAITYNGELYNARELRAELEACGQAFRSSHSDTEVVLRAYLEWGEDGLRRLDGMFAFGLWDEGEERLLLARDRLGVKPLFYASLGSAVLFASEPKALLAHPLVRPAVGADGLAEILNLVPIHSPGFAVFRGVAELRPGHFATFSRARSEVRRYWSLRSEPHADDLATTASRLRGLLDDVVERQLVSDVPLAVLLSGGLDSSALTAIAAAALRRSGGRLRTYALDFVDSDRHFAADSLHASRDSPWADAVAQHVDTDHRRIVIGVPELLENLAAPAHGYDLPGRNGERDVSLFLLFEAMRKDVKVTLCGEAADEIFGGYRWFHRPEMLEAPTFPWAASASAWNDVPWLLPDVKKTIALPAYVARRYREAVDEVPRDPSDDPVAARTRVAYYLHLTRLLPLWLDRMDRMSMAVGMEVRVPFTDHRLVEYVWNIPTAMKDVDGIEKGILRRAVAGLLPEDVRMRQKSPFPASLHPEYRRGIHERALAILRDRASPVRELVDVAYFESLAAPEISGFPGAYAVAPQERVIQLDLWLRTYRPSLG